MSAVTNFPNWVMLERFIFRKDDEESFPDESKAPIRAFGVTSWCAPFRVAFKLEDAPKISRLYAQLPGFPDPSPLAVMATHHHLVLFRVFMMDTDTAGGLLQDFFIYDASDAGNPSSSLRRLSTCTLRDTDEVERLRRRHPAPSVLEYRRVMNVASMGFLSRGKGHPEFAVAELSFVGPDPDVPLVGKVQVHADLFVLRSSESGSDAVGLWKYARIAVRSNDRSSGKSCLTWPDFSWQTDTVISARNSLCWIDYYSGMVSCNLFQEKPRITFSGFPLDEFSLAEDRGIASCWFYCGASAIDDGDAIKIVRVIRHDGKRYGPLQADAGFTITFHSYQLHTTATATVWQRDYSKDCTVTSADLWSCNPSTILPRKILMFPQVNIDRPNIIQFLIVDEFRLVMKKMFVVTIDMNTWIVESYLPYIKGEEDIGTEYAELMKRRSRCPQPFLPSDFSKFLDFSRTHNISLGMSSLNVIGSSPTPTAPQEEGSAQAQEEGRPKRSVKPNLRVAGPDWCS